MDLSKSDAISATAILIQSVLGVQYHVEPQATRSMGIHSMHTKVPQAKVEGFNCIKICHGRVIALIYYQKEEYRIFLLKRGENFEPNWVNTPFCDKYNNTSFKEMALLMRAFVEFCTAVLEWKVSEITSHDMAILREYNSEDLESDLGLHIDDINNNLSADFGIASSCFQADI